jgi:O-acetyl-ADP-ribose deacetylase (regulator of RNase III)
MGKGIAAEFKKRFNGVKELKAQDRKVGQAAVLKTDQKKVYYLVTKERYYQKPTYESLRSSLLVMKTLMVSAGEREIAMPRIGCGLDRLCWEEVYAILKEIFETTNIRVWVYTLK